MTSCACSATPGFDAPNVGVEPLADRASHPLSCISLEPEEWGIGVVSHLASHMLSAFTFRRQELVSGDDVPSVLAIAEYYLNQMDSDSAAHESNQLRDTAKPLLTDWLDAAKRQLEVHRALEVCCSFRCYQTCAG